jgi:hypothetical protein
VAEKGEDVRTCGAEKEKKNEREIVKVRLTTLVRDTKDWYIR